MMREFAKMAKFKKYIELLDVLDEAKTATEASNDSDIPRATVYRYLRRMEGVGLVEDVGTKHSGDTLGEQINGRPETLWQRQIDALELDLDGSIPIRTRSDPKSQSPVSADSGGPSV